MTNNTSIKGNYRENEGIEFPLNINDKPTPLFANGKPLATSFRCLRI